MFYNTFIEDEDDFYDYKKTMNYALRYDNWKHVSKLAFHDEMYKCHLHLRCTASVNVILPQAL